MIGNKKIIIIIGLGLITSLFMYIYEGDAEKMKGEYDESNYYGETYENDPYEKFLQEKVLPDMIKNNKIEGCTLPSQDTEMLKEEIDLGEGTILIEDENFIEKIDEIYLNLNKYVGRTISFEGVVFRNVEGDKNEYIIGRYYEESHDNHSHESIVGLKIIYDEQLLEVDTWAQVKGIIEKSDLNGQEIPVIRLGEFAVKSEEGQRKVYN